MPRRCCSSKTAPAATHADTRIRVIDGIDSAGHAPHGEQLRPRSGRSDVFPRRDVHAHSGGNTLRPVAAQCQRWRVSLRTADAEVRGLRHLRFRQSAWPRWDRWGETWWSMAPGPILFTGPSSPAISIFRKSTAARRPSINSAPGHAPASNTCRAGIFPIRCRGIYWSVT